MVDFGANKDRWVCPNDRQLALRAKLKTGWSVKTQQLQSFGQTKPVALDENEQAAILQVIQRAEALEATEQERIGRLVERLENMKRNAMGNGTSQCILCGDTFGMLGAPSLLLCHDCKKAVCQKCGIETLPASSSSSNPNSSSQKELQWLCKICSETREMWKKSGAWFFKGIPKYKLPEKKPPSSGKINEPGVLKTSVPKLGKSSSSSRTRPPLTRGTWARSGSILANRERSVDQEEESSSEDELGRRARLTRAADNTSNVVVGEQVLGSGRVAPIAAALKRENVELSNSWSRSTSGETAITPSWATSRPNRGTLQTQRSDSISYSGTEAEQLPAQVIETQKFHTLKTPASNATVLLPEPDSKMLSSEVEEETFQSRLNEDLKYYWVLCYDSSEIPPGTPRDFQREGSAESGDSVGSSGVSRQGTVESIGGRSASSSSSSFSSGGRQRTWDADGDLPPQQMQQQNPSAQPVQRHHSQHRRRRCSQRRDKILARLEER